MLNPEWSADVLSFWFDQCGSGCWFSKDPAFDATVRRRFLALHDALARVADDQLLANARTALYGRGSGSHAPAGSLLGGEVEGGLGPVHLAVAQEALARSFDAELSKEERMFLYLPFEHAEDCVAQARCVALMATLGDAELNKWAEAHRSIVDRFGRFPHRNGVLGRVSTPEETEFLTKPSSSF